MPVARLSGRIRDRPRADFIVSFKGCGAELANVQRVLTPLQVGEGGIGIKKLVLESVVDVRRIPCPSVAIGIGIGGQTHYAYKLSRKAVSVRVWIDTNSDEEAATLERASGDSQQALSHIPCGRELPLLDHEARRNKNPFRRKRRKPFPT